MVITYKPIGIIHSPFDKLEQMPIQPTGYASGAGVLELFPEFAEGLMDVEGFSHLYILYHFHKVYKSSMVVTPYMVDEPHGIFATRAPNRPNPIGLFVVKLIRVDGNRIYVEDLDVLDKTPLLDIKPYVPEFENTQEVHTGWLEKVRGKVRKHKSDNRFQ